MENDCGALFLFDKSYTGNIIIGTDEAGRGPGAGPVFAAAVHFPDMSAKIISQLTDLNDSKQLSHKKREELYDIIKQNTLWAIHSATVEEIEKYNILQASLRTMRQACNDVILQINKKNIKVLVDGNKLIPQFNIEQEKLIKGDSRSASVAAASILAKVERDRFMQTLHIRFPQYHWDKNKGYLTKEHVDAIEKHGITPHHRKKFLRKLTERKQLSLF